MITIRLVNPPPLAATWSLGIFGAGVSYESETVPIDEPASVELPAIRQRFDITLIERYGRLIGRKSIEWPALKDGMEYTYNWATEELSELEPTPEPTKPVIPSLGAGALIFMLGLFLGALGDKKGKP